MAGNYWSCPKKNYTERELARLQDKSQNVLQNPQARDAFKHFVQQSRRTDLKKTLELYESALDPDSTLQELEEKMFEVDRISIKSSPNLSDKQVVAEFIKNEVYRICNEGDVLVHFVEHLRKKQKRGG